MDDSLNEPLIILEEKLSTHILPQLRPVPNHFTASALVIEEGHILLVHHRRIGAWLPPGGHIEPGELPHEAAMRETFEETGVEVQVLTQPVPFSLDTDAFFLHQPLCVHGVFAVEDGESLYHIDMAYLCQVQSAGDGAPPLLTIADEVQDAAWIPLAGLGSLNLAKNVKELVDLALAKLRV